MRNGLVAGYSQSPVVVMRLWESGVGVDQRGNEVLGALLAELGWSPTQLAGAVNGCSGRVVWRALRRLETDLAVSPSPPSGRCPSLHDQLRATHTT